VDCARLIAECLIACKLAEPESVGLYGHDWFHHTTEERYLFYIMRHAALTIESIAYRSLMIEPGCIVAMKAARSKVVNHAGIVTAWPMVVHAIYDGVAEVDASRDPMWIGMKIEIFDPFAKICSAEKQTPQ